MKLTSKRTFYFLVGFIGVITLFFAAKPFFSKKTSIVSEKTSIKPVESSVKKQPKVISFNADAQPVAFVDVPIETVCSYFYDTFGLTIIPGEHKSALVRFTGKFGNVQIAKAAFSAVLNRHNLSLSGDPLVITANTPELEFTRIDWGKSNKQIFLFLGSKMYRVEDFPFLLRRDSSGNFFAALPASMPSKVM